MNRYRCRRAQRVQAEEWENFGLATVDSSLIYSMIDVCSAAGRPVGACHRGPAHTTIETNLVSA